jgi:multicomponent Na+:H+ antiporter subunit E
MRTITMNVFLAIAWAAVTGTFTFLNLLFGFAVGGFALYLIRDEIGAVTHFRRFVGAVTLSLVFFWELVKSSVNVAVIVLTPGRKLQPAIFAYPLTVKSDVAITLLANLITLTPGTLSMDVSDDRSTLFVHSIDAPDVDAMISGIHDSFETRIMALFEPAGRMSGAGEAA